MLKKVKIPPLRESQRLALNKYLKISQDTRMADKADELAYTKARCASEGVEWIEGFSYTHRPPKDSQDFEKFKRFGDLGFRTHLEYLETLTHRAYSETIKACTDLLIGALGISKYLEDFDTSKLGSFEAIEDTRDLQNPFKRVKLTEVTPDTPVFIDFFEGFNTKSPYWMRMRVLISE